LIEAVQVKSYSPLRLSHLGSEKKQEPFFKRAATLLHSNNEVAITAVNFGETGPELNEAWQNRSNLAHTNRQNVAQKLKEKHGLTDDEVLLVFDRIELKSMDETTIHSDVMEIISNTVAGIDASSAFDLFMQWIYQLSEKRECATQAEIIAKLNDVGRVLTDRSNFLAEWHTSIKPLEDQEVVSASSLEGLRTEFFAGVSARYAHIEANLDFRRDEKLLAIAEGFRRQDIVIVHGASGEGKTALAYRFLHDHYPATWRYEVELIENPTHALKIASALNAQASSLNAPIMVYIDVRPNDTNWAELIEQLTRHSYIKVLVTVREEDFRRTSLPSYRLQYESIALRFNEVEAQSIYDRAIESDKSVQAHFLTFDASWESFNEGGPLLEYVYLLTQTETLQTRLDEQVTNIATEVAKQAVTDKWDVLRWIAVASAYEARVDYGRLRNMVARPALIGQIVSQLEEEYLIRQSEDGHWLEGLHPIRSRIITHLMAHNDPPIWLETAKEILPALAEADLQLFILNTLVDRPASDYTPFISHLTTCYPQTWTGKAGVFRALLWAGVRDYIETNRSLIDQVQSDVQRGWAQIVLDIDLSGLMDDPLPFDQILFERITPAKRQEIEAYRALQTPKSDTFQYAATWLHSFNTRPLAPSSYTDWVGIAEIMAWAGHLNIIPGIDDWITYEQFVELVTDQEMQLVGDVSLALYLCNPEQHKDWTDKQEPIIDARLADEYQILAIERDSSGKVDGESRIRIHFIPTQIQNKTKETVNKNGAEQNQLHTATMERVELVRYLYPIFERYASQGYGFQLGKSLALPFDETVKDVMARYIVPHWFLRINQFARGIGEYPYRPQTWEEFADKIVAIRRRVLTNLSNLQEGLVRYLGRSKGLNVIETHLETSEWDKTKRLLFEIPQLPQSAVDRWGFSSETNNAASPVSTEASGMLGIDPNNPTSSRYIPRAMNYQEYAPYLQAQNNYLGNLSTFFEQSIHVMLTNIWVKKFHKDDPHHETVRQKMEELGYRTDYDQLSIRNYWKAVLHLHEFQYQFRQLLAPFIDIDELSNIERLEHDIVPNTWACWFFFATNPQQTIPNARRRSLLKVEWNKMALDRSIDTVLSGINSTRNETWNADRIATEMLWKESPTLWIKIDVFDPMDHYAAVEALIEDFRAVFGKRDVRSLSDYLLEQHYEYIVIIPTIRGKLIQPLCYAPNFAATLFADKPLSESPFALRPSELTEEQLTNLDLQVWEDDDFNLVNQIGNAFNAIRILAFQMGEFSALPEHALTDAGLTKLQSYANTQMSLLSDHLQQYFDAASELCANVNALSERELVERKALRECVDIISEINNNIMPSEDGELQFTLTEIRDYAENLESIWIAGELLRLTWISDILG
jgi:hypothetical protein